MTANPKTPEPTASLADDRHDDPPLMRAVQDYLAELEAGRSPSRTDYLRRHPEIAGPLAECLEALDMVHKGAGRSLKDFGNLRSGEPIGPGKLPSGEPIDGLPGNPLGDFRIVREIGRGGMGVVYEAIQLSLGRRVALKVLPLAATFDAKCLQRFHNEAKAAASLHHTNIVPVYAVDCERGVHFYAMQLIEGQSLATILAEVRRAETNDAEPITASVRDLAGMVEDVETEKGVPRLYRPDDTPAAAATESALSEKLTTFRTRDRRAFYRWIARIVQQAADGLEHAHEFGIVHRDIKPANLLVDMHGRPWITDFGLAQFHTDASVTRTGDVLGTLRYMSPEQASGQRVLLDHRTDIYSLGATLYELATLSPMFVGQNQQELLRQILHEEPPAPRTVEPRIPVELETIILKAVNKNPADRYPSAQEMAADLERYLEDKPIHAKRPGLLERGRKWCRRHPGAVSAAMLLLFFGVLGFAVSTFMVAGAYERERQRAEEAEERFKLARRSTDEMIRIAQEDLADNPMMQDVRRRLLEAAFAYYQEFIDQRRDRPDAQAELAATRNLVKKILDDLIVLRGAGRTFLLKNPSVQDDLDLSPDQRDQVRAFFERGDRERQQSLADLHKLSPEERQNRFVEVVRADDAAVTAILTSAQLHRLGQLARQSQGIAAFRDADVVQKLNLTAEQKRQIRSIEARLFLEPPPPPPFGGPGKGGPPGKRMGEKQRTAVNEITGLLTPDQRRRWNELIGPPFAKAAELFHHGGPGFPPPGPLAADRNEKSEVRGQRSEVRGQKSETVGWVER